MNRAVLNRAQFVNCNLDKVEFSKTDLSNCSFLKLCFIYC